MKKYIVSIRTLKTSFMRHPSVVAGILALTTLTNVPNAFAAPADKPDQLANQTHTTSTLATIATIDRNANRGAKNPTVYKGNVYGIYIAQEGVVPTETTKNQGTQRIMVYKVPLDSSSAAVCQPLQPVPNPLPPSFSGYPNIAGIYAAYDNHCDYTLAIDRSGYIHVSGGMHTCYIHYWRSDAPENISSFTRITEKGGPPPGTTLRKIKKNNVPIGGPPPGTPLATPIHPAQRITFPKFITGSHGQLMWTSLQGPGVPLSSYDETTKLWTPLGGTSPNPESDGVLTYAYSDYHALQKFWSAAIDSNNRMHMAFSLISKEPVGDRPSPIATDVIYAYSDDGGKTAYRSNGKQIKLPIRAEDIYPDNQGDIVIRESDANIGNKWLTAHVSISVDKENRPMIQCSSYTTGDHRFRLESGKWVDYSKSAPSPSTDSSEGVNSKYFKSFLTDANPDGWDKDYYRETGELVWLTLKGTATDATLTLKRTVFKNRSTLGPDKKLSD